MITGMESPFSTRLETPETLQAAVEFFADEDRCIAYLVQTRWPDGNITCPICNRPEPRYLAKQRRFECRGKHPRKQFSVKVGTIFEDSPIALKSWLLAMWQITACKNGISSYELHRALGVTQKTAWFMNHRIRLAMQDTTTGGSMFGGTVEVDETYIGGKARYMHKDKRQKAIKGRGPLGKAAVMGLLQRHETKGKSRVRLTVVPNTRRHQLQSRVEKHIEDGSAVFTDALKSYDGLGLYYQHSVIDHAERYADGQVHTNGLENFWSLLKRSIKGTYVSVEPFHLFRYLDEQAFRFNERSGTDAERFEQTLRQVTGKRVTFEQLIGNHEEEARA
jgi:transposase-like protein